MQWLVILQETWFLPEHSTQVSYPFPIHEPDHSVKPKEINELEVISLKSRLKGVTKSTCIRFQVQNQADLENTGAIPSTNLENTYK